MKVNKAFIPFIKSKKRYAVLIGGAGSSKSFSTVQKIIARILTERKHRFLCVRKVAATLRNSVFQTFIDRLIEYGFYSEFVINKSEMRLTHLLTGNEIILAGMDDPEKIKSIAGITGVWCEEATELDEADFNQLELRVRGETVNYKQFILTFNPINEDHWLKKRFFDRADDDVFVLKTTFLDNAFLDEDYKKHLKERVRLNENLYKIYVLGEWGSEGDGNILKKEWFPIVSYHDFLKDVSNPEWEIFIDSAYTEKTTNDPTAIMVVCKHGNMATIKDSQQVWMQFPDLIREIKSLAALNNAHKIYIEPKASGLSIAQQLRKETTLNIIELMPPKEDKVSRLNSCAPVIEGKRVQLIKGSWNDCFLNECVRFPNGLHDDQVDNLSAIVNKYYTNKLGRRAVSI